MLVEIPDVLDAGKLAQVQKLLQTVSFVDGKLSAGSVAQRNKHNTEANPSTAQLQELNQLVMGTLVSHPTFQHAALPHRIAVPYYARYTSGQHYGEHIDDPIMGPAGQRYRSDIAVTVFLNNSSAYDGGELTIRTSYGEQRIKGQAGSAVLYPAASLHRVTPLTRGERLVAVTWIQSLIRDPTQRELLYELHQVRQHLLNSAPDDENSKRLDRSYVNLVRMWSEL